MDDEVDICRVCRCEATPDQPLFHPCRCSGSIKYVHQDCLIEWLSHSKKKYCELCKHSFAFTPIYAPDMPETIPMFLFMRRGIRRVLSGILLFLRAWLVMTVWTVVLPYITVWVWRFYFWSGDNIAFGLNGLDQPPPHETDQNATMFAPMQNVVSEMVKATIDLIVKNNNTETLAMKESYSNMASKFVSDCFEGQIITCIVVIVFVAAFLLREWIIQNTPAELDGVAEMDHIPEAQQEQPQRQAPEERVLFGNRNPLAPIPQPAPTAARENQHLPPPPIPSDFQQERADQLHQQRQNLQELMTQLRANVQPAQAADAHGQGNGFNWTSASTPDKPTDSQDNLASSDFRFNFYAPASRQGDPGASGPSRAIFTFQTSLNGGQGGVAGESNLSDRQTSTSNSHAGVDKDEKDAAQKPYRTASLFITHLPAARSSDSLNSRSPNEASSRPASTSGEQTSAPFASSPPDSSKNFVFNSTPPSSSNSTLNQGTARSDKPTETSGTLRFDNDEASRPRPFRFESTRSNSTEEGRRENQPSLMQPAWGFDELAAKIGQSLPPGTESRVINTERGRVIRITKGFPVAKPSTQKASAEAGESSRAGTAVDEKENQAIRSDKDIQPVSNADKGKGVSTHSQAVDEQRVPVNSVHTPISEPDQVPPSTTGLRQRIPHRYQDDNHEADDENAGNSERWSDVAVIGGVTDADRHASLPPQHVPIAANQEETFWQRIQSWMANNNEENEHEEHEVPEQHVPAPNDHEDGLFRFQGAALGHEDEHGLDHDNVGGMAGEGGQQGMDEGEEDEEAGEEEEEEEEIAEDDLEGMFEAIGIRGPLWMLLQNSALMALLISLCLGASVFVPYVTGKTLILIKPLKLIQLPLTLTQIITNPIVEWLVTKFIEPGAKAIWRMVEPLCSNFFSLANDESNSILYGGSQFLQKHWKQVMTNEHFPFFSPSSLNNTLTNQTLSLPFTPIANAIGRWQQIPSSNSPVDRTICVLVGYVIMIGMGAWYLAKTKNMYGRTVNRAMQQAIHQQGIILKVAFFVAIELVVFPIICGILLDLSTLPLFPNNAARQRYEFHEHAPFTSLFMHWFLGTGFMFHFAVFVSMCRDTVRPGVMWFIRDPNDPQFHPIKEILERPVLTQLQKIGTSALMYSGMVVVGIGGVVHAISWCIPGVLPLNTDMSLSLSDFPIDLLALHLIIPVTVDWAKPKRILRKLFTKWWRATARLLRLTSFMFDERKEDEEGYYVGRSWYGWLTGQTTGPGIEFIKDGGFVRAPRYDGVPVIQGRRMLIPVNEQGERLVEQDDSRFNPRLDTSNTVVVYVPPRFRLRVTSFLLLMWLTGSAFVCACTIIPLLTGRRVFRHYLGSEKTVHDIYAFSVGAYLVWGVGLVIDWVVRGLLALKAEDWKVDLKAVAQRVGSATLLVLKLLYVSVALGVVIPFLFALAIELYILLPARYSPKEDTRIEINFLQDWALGLIYIKIFTKAATMLGENRWSRTINEITENGIRRLNVGDLTRKVIVPVGGGLLLGIFVPLVVSWVAIVAMEVEGNLKVAVFRYMYPILAGVGIVYKLQRQCFLMMRRWMQVIRDEEYLIGRRLHNLAETEGETGGGNEVGEAVEEPAAR
ncbi:uncharacterized protein VTP21DRAFT_2974 [Calcarisporiella thermophila]|uniref:uncharacterized protein n=1 Tax=Calcarisporiella thermophila TaxID=911321 RepID=UPI00374478B0